MKKFLFLSIFIIPTTIFAQDAVVKSFTTIGTLVDAFTSSVLQSLGVLCMSAAVTAFFFGVVQYINGMRNGNGEKAKSGNLFMVWGLVALFVMFSIWGIIYFAQGLFGIQGMNDISKLFGGNIRAGVTNQSQLISPSGQSISPVFQAGGGVGGGNSGGVGWSVGGMTGGAGGVGGAGATFQVGGGGTSNGTGIGFTVGGGGVQSSGFMINGVPASQVPGVLSCNGRSAGSRCGIGMECAIANDNSMSCFRSVDVRGGAAVTNARAAVDPARAGGASNNAGADCSPEDKNACTGGTVCVAFQCAFSTASQMGPTEADIPASAQAGYSCTPTFDCRTPTGTDGVCTADGKACVTTGSTYNPAPVSPSDYTIPSECADFECQ
jgi:hypothetical protein